MTGYLVDTHVLLWAMDDDPQLSQTHRALFEDDDESFFVSIASIWEVSIKQGLGKLSVPDNFLQLIDEGGIKVLEIRADVARQVRHLPQHHGDPFDRMLITQAQIYRFTIMTEDRKFAAYDVSLI